MFVNHKERIKNKFIWTEYEGASTSEGQDDQEKSERQDEGDGVSSEGEKSSVAGVAEVGMENKFP